VVFVESVRDTDRDSGTKGEAVTEKDYTFQIVDDGTLDTVVRVEITRASEIGEVGDIHVFRFNMGDWCGEGMEWSAEDLEEAVEEAVDSLAY
jgi:hypothetical protein